MPVSADKAKAILNALFASYREVVEGQGERTIGDVIECTLQWFEKKLPGQFTREEILTAWLHHSLDALMGGQQREKPDEKRIILLQ